MGGFTKGVEYGSNEFKHCKEVADGRVKAYEHGTPPLLCHETFSLTMVL